VGKSPTVSAATSSPVDGWLCVTGGSERESHCSCGCAGASRPRGAAPRVGWTTAAHPARHNSPPRPPPAPPPRGVARRAPKHQPLVQRDGLDFMPCLSLTRASGAASILRGWPIHIRCIDLFRMPPDSSLCAPFVGNECQSVEPYAF